ncbi:hypothetical protein D1F64_10350 [Breoghania sp. L-A4]|nr:hypothetical protein D1F64_10350 [Breoghania sp. L-A4]
MFHARMPRAPRRLSWSRDRRLERRFAAAPGQARAPSGASQGPVLLTCASMQHPAASLSGMRLREVVYKHE